MGKFEVLENLQKKIKAIQGTKLTVGVQSETGTNYQGEDVSGEESIESSDITYKELAGVHEFGYMGKDKNGREMNIPERSFVRSVRNDASLTSDLKKEVEVNLAGYILDKQDLETSLNNIGHHAVTDIVVRMPEDKTPLKETTQKQRSKKDFNANRPLIAGGQLRNHVTYVVRKKGD